MLSRMASVGTRTNWKEAHVTSLDMSDHRQKSHTLRIIGLCLGIAGVVAMNMLAPYRVQVEVTFLTVLVCWFFGYDFWQYRNHPHFFGTMIVSLIVHTVVIAALWPLLP